MSDQQQEMMEYTTQDLIAFLVEDYQMQVDDAMDRVYSSKTFENLANVETGLYLQGSAYVYERLKAEIDRPN